MIFKDRLVPAGRLGLRARGPASTFSATCSRSPKNLALRQLQSESQTGLCDPAEADLELFCNSWSAGFGENGCKVASKQPQSGRALSITAEELSYNWKMCFFRSNWYSLSPLL